MTERAIKVGQDFMVDGVDPVHDGAGVIWYAIQMVDRAHKSVKYTQVVCESIAGKLTPVLRVDSMIGSPSIVIRPADGTAYVLGGGKDNTIVTGVSIPGFVPLLLPADVLRNVDGLARMVALLSTTLTDVAARVAALEDGHD